MYLSVGRRIAGEKVAGGIDRVEVVLGAEIQQVEQRHALAAAFMWSFSGLENEYALRLIFSLARRRAGSARRAYAGGTSEAKARGDHGRHHRGGTARNLRRLSFIFTARFLAMKAQRSAQGIGEGDRADLCGQSQLRSNSTSERIRDNVDCSSSTSASVAIASYLS